MFDPGAIEVFRRHVETRTATIIAAYTILGLLVGVLVMSLLFGHDVRDPQLGALGSVALGLLGAGLGYLLGSERAFVLRLQAQMTLFQAHIEANTQRYGFDCAPTRIDPPPQSLLVKAGLRC
jgi:hypothetical protein